ncbi:MAG TPA: YbaK/EbsC family protein [Planctomycetota bacterium]|jgi:Ala-tRNA(Pro) deacylase
MDRLREYLDTNGIRYTVIVHSKAYTAQEIAAAVHVPGKAMAKTVVAKAGDQFALAVLPAHHRVDLRELRAAVGAPVRLATEAEFQGLFPECELGAMSPFGNLYNLPVWVAEPLIYDDEIVFNCGTHSAVIRMKYADFARLVQPHVANFSMLQTSPPRREPVA